MLAGIPYGGIGDPDGIARAAVWLASDETDHSSAQRCSSMAA